MYCVSHGTIIRKDTGRCEIINKLQIGDNLLSIDNKISKVTAINCTTKKLYKIVFNDQFLFCSEDTVLTVCGLTPDIIFLDSVYYLTYSIRGKDFCKIFTEKNKAEEFKNNIPNDIYEISVKDILKQTPRHIYLFPQTVEYPVKKLTMSLSENLIPDEYIYNTKIVLKAIIHRFFGNNVNYTALNEQIAKKLEQICLSLGYEIYRQKNHLQLYSSSPPIFSFVISKEKLKKCIEFSLSEDGRFLLDNYLLIGKKN